MVKANALEDMLTVLNNSHLLKSWSIYNDRYNGDVVVRVRFMQVAECGEAGSISAGTFKRKTPHQAVRDQTRADHYKQTRNAKQNMDTRNAKQNMDTRNAKQNMDTTNQPLIPIIGATGNMGIQVSAPINDSIAHPPAPSNFENSKQVISNSSKFVHLPTPKSSPILIDNTPIPQPDKCINIGKSSLRGHQNVCIEANRHDILDQSPPLSVSMFSPEAVAMHGSSSFSPNMYEYVTLNGSPESPSTLTSPVSLSPPTSPTTPVPSMNPAPMSARQLRPSFLEQLDKALDQSLANLVGSYKSRNKRLADDSKD